MHVVYVLTVDFDVSEGVYLGVCSCVVMYYVRYSARKFRAFMRKQSVMCIRYTRHLADKIRVCDVCAIFVR